MRRIMFLTLLSLLCLCSLISCEREPALFLCDHNDTGHVRLAVDWSRFTRYENPSGMTVRLFRQGDDGKYKLLRATSTNDITHVDYGNLSPGVYSAFVINQSEDEFASVKFENLDDWDKACLHTTKGASKWYKDTIMSSPLVSDIEWIGTDSHENIKITQAALDSAKGATLVIDTLHPQNIVRAVTVFVHIQNIGGLRSARAYLQGLAGGYMHGKNHTSAEKVTQLLETWHMTIDSTTTSGRKDGTIEAQIASLGLPDGHCGTPHENMLHLECLLKNDSILKFDYPVGDKFEYSYDFNVDLHFTINITMKDPLPDVPDKDNGSSAFQVTVEDWGNENTIVIDV